MEIVLYTSERGKPPFLAVLASFGDVAVRGHESAPNHGSADLVVLDLRFRPAWREELLSSWGSETPRPPVVAILEPRQLAELTPDLPFDDFLVQGCCEEEARARIARVVARLGEVNRLPGLSIDAEKYEVRVDGVPVELTYKEFELLRYLSTHPGKVLTREALLREVWGYDYFGGSRTVDVHIRRIRSKIEKGGRTYIKTVRGVGYLFDPEG